MYVPRGAPEVYEELSGPRRCPTGHYATSIVVAGDGPMHGERRVGWMVPPTIAVVGVLAAFVAGSTVTQLDMSKSEWAAWVQAVGSIAAICAGFGAVLFQNWLGNKQRDRDRDDLAKVVAARLSIWIVEVGALIQAKLEDYEDMQKRSVLLSRDTDLEEFKLNISGGIESVMSDLHHLRKGSADVAQLAYCVKEFDAFVDKAASKLEWAEFHTQLGRRLGVMKQLHTEAVGHLDAIISAAAKEKR